MKELKYVKHNYNRDGRYYDHAMADILYRLNIGKCVYGFVLTLPNVRGLVSNNKMKQIGQLHGWSRNDVINMLSQVSDLSDIFLNNFVYYDLDRWLYSQWENYVQYNSMGLQVRANKSGKIDVSKVYKKMRKTKLKEFYFVRIFDTLCVVGKSYETLNRLQYAIYNKLRRFENISIDMVDIIDLRKKPLIWCDFNYRLVYRRNKWIVESHINKGCVHEIYNVLKNQLENIISSNDGKTRRKEMIHYNWLVYKWHENHKYATCINIDVSKLGWALRKKVKHTFERDGKKSKQVLRSSNIDWIDKYLKRKNNYHYFVYDFVILSLSDVSHVSPMFYKE